MRVSVERAVCKGHALCEGMASSVFELDDDDVATVLVAEPTGPDAAKASQAASSCPEGAIVIEQ